MKMSLRNLVVSLFVFTNILSFVIGNYHNGTFSFLAYHKKFFYFVHRGKIRKLPPNHRETIVHLRLDPNNARNISTHHFKSLSVGTDIPIIEITKQNEPDEIFRVMCLVNKILQGRLIEDVFFIGRYINPSIVAFRGRFLMATGLAWTVNGVSEGKPAHEHIEFRWINHTRYPFYSDEPYAGLTQNIAILESGGILGQDPRMVRVNENKVMMVYTNRYEPRPRMGTAELIYNTTSKKIERGRVMTTLFFNTKNPEKNWSPFLVGENDVYLIQSINPMCVVGFIPVDPVSERGSTIVASDAPLAHHPFQFGHLRGGTNAIDLGDKYLAFFHSTTIVPGNYLTTYFMGAYTFTKAGPWRLLSISPEPILDDWMYQGPYAPFKNRKMDYVIFPNSLNRLSEEEILVGFGYQDDRGFAARMKLKAVLESMVPVVYCDTEKHSELRERYCGDAKSAPPEVDVNDEGDDTVTEQSTSSSSNNSNNSNNNTTSSNSSISSSKNDNNLGNGTKHTNNHHQHHHRHQKLRHR